MMVMLDATVVAIANPAIGLDLHASLSGLQWVTNAYLLAVAVLIITAGKAGDRFGRKRIFLTGVVGFALASAACGFAPSIGALIAFRAVQGLMGALLMPSTLAIISADFPDRLLQQAQSARAQRRAHRVFATTRHRARQQEAGDVEAGQQPNAKDHSIEQE